MSTPSTTSASRHFRDVLGQFPTGVATICALDADGVPVGMAVGSFGSVSLDPPLVSFMPAASSTTYPRIAAASSFCVSILAADQEDVCRSMASRDSDKFKDIAWSPSPSGAPVIDGAIAWIDCTIEQTHDAGDHLIVIGRVQALEQLDCSPPLVFFRGGYGEFTTSSLVAAPEFDLVEPITLAGRARFVMEKLSLDLGLESVAVALVHDQTVSLAVADAPHAHYTSSRVGYRTPLAYPVASVFAAWSDREEAVWMPTDTSQASLARAALDRVRRRRWSVAIGNPEYDSLERAVGHVSLGGKAAVVENIIGALDPDHFDIELEPDRSYDVRILMAPVFGPDGNVALALSVRGFSHHLTGAEIAALAKTLVQSADEVSRKIHGLGDASSSTNAERIPS